MSTPVYGSTSPFIGAPFPEQTGIESPFPNLPPINPYAINQPSYLDRVLPGLIAPFTKSTAPLNPSFPDIIATLERKYASPEFQSITPQIRRALLDADFLRLKRGNEPLPKSSILNLAQSLAGIRTDPLGPFTTVSAPAITPPPEPNPSPLNVLNNVKSDLSTITSSILKLPFALAKEVTELPNIPTRISEAQARGDNLITAVASAPGVRLLPGSYIAGNVARGGEGLTELATHPLFTFLDILPAAKSAKLGTKFGKLPIPGTARTFSDLAESTRAAYNRTNLGQFTQSMWSQQNRDLAALNIGIRDRVRHAMDPNVDRSLSFGVDDIFAANESSAAKFAEFGQRYQALIPEPRRAELAEAAIRAPNDLHVTSDPLELAYLEEARALTDELAQIGIDANYYQSILLDGSWEIVLRDDLAVKRLIKRREHIAQYETILPIIDAVRTHTPVQLPGVQGVVTNLDAAQLRGMIDEWLPSIESAPIKQRQTMLRGVGILLEQNGFSLPTRYFDNVNRAPDTALRSISAHQPVSTGGPIRELRTAHQRRYNYLASYNKVTSTQIAKFRNSLPRMEQRVVPARWHELIHDRLKASASSRLELHSANPNFDLLTEHLANGRYRHLIDEGIITRKEFDNFLSEAQASISELRRAGWNPHFLHRVHPNAVQSINYPTVLKQLGNLDSPRSPSRVHLAKPTQVKQRTYDYSPHVKDFTVALPHQALEWVVQRGAADFMEELLRVTPRGTEVAAPFARTRASLENAYAGAARARKQFNPTIDTNALIERAINREWTRFPIESLPAEMKTRLGFAADDLGASHPYIPRSVYKNIRHLVSPPELNALLDVPLSVFRTSLLPLSPRWHIYNFVGGAIMLMATTNPITVWKNLGRAIEVGKAVRAGQDVSHILPETMRQTFGSSTEPLIEFQVRAGSKLGELVHGRATEPSSLVSKSLPVVQKAGDLVQKLFRANGIVDDMYRSLAYLYGYDKSIAKSLNHTQAMAAGERLARRTLQTLDELTPMERTTLRYIMPFYGWTQHILRYAYNYPIDHPFRVAVTASIARNELADLGTGLPQTLMNALFLGHPDDTGHIKSINLQGMNPFRDVASMMTLAGFVSSTNPIIATGLQQLGFNQFGETNLYPNLQYDPSTGRLKATSPNALTNFIYNSIPQSRLIAGLLDRSSELQELFRTNPAAAQRLILSQAGFPILFRDYDIEEETLKAETNRYQSARDALRDALKTGNDSYANQFPTVRPLLAQIRGLQASNQLTQYDPTTHLQELQNTLADRVA